jgi:hypothetical protein
MSINQSHVCGCPKYLSLKSYISKMELGGPHPFFRGKMKGQDRVHQRTLKTKGIIMGEKEETWKKKEKRKEETWAQRNALSYQSLKEYHPLNRYQLLCTSVLA